MTSNVLKFEDSWKIQESNILKTKQFFLQVKNLINPSVRAILWQKILMDATLKGSRPYNYIRT